MTSQKYISSVLTENKLNINIAITMLMVLSVLCLLLLPRSVFAWGPLGHKAICDAAWRASKPEVKIKLADAAKRLGFKTYAESCTWADKIRNNKKYDWVRPLHYMNMPKNAAEVSFELCPSNKRSKPRCVLTAITYFHARWKSQSLSQRERDEALLFFSHFVGDLHQPLHVAFKDDRGGTRTNVVFQGKLMSLHSLWDSPILYCGFKGKWKRLGKQLYQANDRYRSAKHQSNYVWASESFTLTKVIYAKLESRLPKSYCEQFHPLAITRLELASYRLADLLNQSRHSVRKVSGDTISDEVQSAPNLTDKLMALWKSILTYLL